MEIISQPTTKTDYYHSPIGTLKVTGTENGISGIWFMDDKQIIPDSIRDENVADCIRQLDEYFSGKRKTFDLKFDLQGTDFQIRVWKELLNIPYGKTISYLELARRLGDEKVIRAAGSA